MEKEEKPREKAAPLSPPESAADEVRRGPVADLPKKLAEPEPYRDEFLRAKAELANAKKRFEKDRLEIIKFANERIISDVLPAMDNLDRAMASIAEGHDVMKVLEGLKIAQKELHQALEQHGVQVVKSVGEHFDPRFHEAVGVVEDEKTEEGRVMDEIQRGYLLNGRLLRPSRVRVAQKKEG
ncbi:MAG: nucleotide exchange factor GrpE [Candidatus Omnitrophica bacterium]|nr:nucleotide exchange factor GrpE [Candidatus Omnitrophota bacterium]